jgi:hypothetical protein
MLALDELDKDELLAVVLYALDTKALNLDADSNDKNGIVSLFDKQNGHVILKHDRNKVTDESCIENIDQIDLSTLDREKLEQIVKGSIWVLDQFSSIGNNATVD